MIDDKVTHQIRSNTFLGVTIDKNIRTFHFVTRFQGIAILRKTKKIHEQSFFVKYLKIARIITNSAEEIFSKLNLLPFEKNNVF